ncbi:MAG: hypothetical protein NVS4B11_06350 [Ktedonobacteraceae bacterium]
MAQVTLREYLQGIEDTISSGHVDDAVHQCQHVLAQFPESLEVQRLLGEVYLARGQMEDAQQALDWILTNDPENVIAYCDRALISERLSDFDTALDCYQQAYELSRGNRDIRQQFNMLSAKAGQQGFMFSRAGLARLYMRGGLLPQAVQEWDAVLTISPDRLDARIGLLETYWREEMYDEAEQIAVQTLQDVPGCVKALLLLAHITAPKNMHLAQEYVQRAELLDPDLLMAQELFEDMMMSQPGHPFLKLLKKAPAMLDANQASTEPASTPAFAESAFAHVSASEEAMLVPDTFLREMSTSDSPFEWSKLDTWEGEIEPLAKPELYEQPTVEASALPTWSHDTFSHNDSWTVPIQQEVQEPQKQEEIPSFAEQNLNDFQFDAWSQNAHDDATDASKQQGPQVWNDLNHLSALGADESWKNRHDTTQADNVDPSWMSGTQEETPSLPPVWLDMLTQDEQRGQQQPSAAIPPVEREQKQPSIEMPMLSSYAQSAESIPTDHTSDATWRDALQVSLNTTDEEPFFFGPEWLKSLGAAEIGADVQEHSMQSPEVPNPPSEAVLPSSTPAHVPVAEPEPTFDTYTWSEPAQALITEPAPAQSPIVEPEPAFDTYAWSNYLSIEPQPTEQSEHTLLNTLEDLEHDLRSKGFVPLEPNSLSSIAQSQEQEPSSDEPLTTVPYQRREEIYEEEKPYQEPYHEATLSSALAQLGNLVAPSAQISYPSPESLMPAVQKTPHITAPLEEPLWASGLPSVPAPAQEEPHDIEQETQQIASAPNPTPATPRTVPQEQLFTTPNHVEAFPEPLLEPTHVLPRVEVSRIPVAPTARADAFFESELETTMKRPAVRLQAMSQRQHSMTIPQYQSAETIKGRGSESKVTIGGRKDGSRSSQERLVKGYQHQLVGDYDEAMQEYRIIIKSAPELLGEVVSNVRALLKLAPKYSAGYRVLGDAYMRQGEYLQAMEAYNKALTMAKKAKA